MWKWLNPEIVLGLLVATVFWTGVLGWQAAYTPPERIKNECYEAAQKSGHKTEECKSLWERTTSDPVALFTFVLSVSTIGLWLVTWRSGVRQTRDMEGAITAADEANKLNRENFAAGQRPWIEILAVDPIGPFGCNGKTASLRLNVKIKNIGPTPAFIVFPFGGGYHNGPATNMLDIYEKLAADVRKNTLSERTYGGILYPNRERLLTGLSMSPVWHTQHLDEARAERKDDPNSFNPVFIVDIDYTSTYRTSHYQTAMILMIFRLDPNQPGSFLGFDPDGFECQPGEFELRLHPLGHYAD